MSTFITRIKNEMSNYRGRPDKATISRRDLQELIRHFEAMDSALRSEHDSTIPTRNQNRYACLAHEIQAAFHNLGAEETLDIVMFTISELRKQQIKQSEIKTPISERCLDNAGWLLSEANKGGAE